LPTVIGILIILKVGYDGRSCQYGKIRIQAGIIEAS